MTKREARVGEQRLHTAIVRDVGQRKRAHQPRASRGREAQRRERLADIGAITAKILHDIGNPLAGLTMQAELVRRRAETNGLREPATRILDCVRRLDRLFHGFQSFLGEQKLNLEGIALPGLLETVVNEWQPTAGKRGITLVLEVDAGSTVHADEEQLRRVLDNLIKNAIEAIDPGPGSVRISGTSPTNDMSILKVTDSGPGIAPDFDPFQLFETTKPQGTGLGLAIAEQIIVAHGGTIDYDQVSPQGTVFTIQLPSCGASLW